MRSVRPVVRPLIAALFALSCVVLVAATAQASVQKIQHPSSRTDRAVSHSLAVSITGVGPQQWATSKTSTVTVSGTLSNHTGSTLRGIQVQLQWYPLTFLTRSDMDSFASGGPVSLQGAQVTLETVGDTTLGPALPNGATTHWTVSFNLSQAFLADGYPPDPRRLPAAGSGQLGHERLPGNQPDLPAVLDRRRLGHAAQGRVDLAADRHAAAGRLPADAGDELAGRAASPPTAGCRRCSTPASSGPRPTI